MTAVVSPEERFWSKVDKSGPNGCWVWTAYISIYGYGTFHSGEGRSKIHAHRFAYEALVGSIPEGMHIDHLCRNRCCCNPAHLEVVTPAENSRRGDSWKVFGLRTHCPQGHEYSPENTYLFRGKRSCRKCHAAVEQRRRKVVAE